MEIKIENLELLPLILQKLENIEKNLYENYSKRWLTIHDLVEYTGYSKDSLYKLKSNEWNENIHYYKRSGKLLFDRKAIDGWIMGDSNYISKETDKQKANRIVDSILNSIKKDIVL